MARKAEEVFSLLPVVVPYDAEVTS
jgi:hypothetical protein